MAHHDHGLLTRFSIKTILFAGLGCLALFLAIAVGRQASKAWDEYSNAARASAFDAGANKFISGLFEVLMERLDSNNALQAKDPVTAEMTALIEARRKTVKENFIAGLEILKQQEFPGKATLLADLNAALDKANQARSQSDAAIKKPVGERDEDLRKNFVPTLTSSVNAALKVWFAALYSSAQSGPSLMRLAAIKEIGWRMRDFSGHERAVIAGAIASAAQIPADKMPLIAESRTRVSLLWAQLQNLANGSGAHPAIMEAMRGAEAKYFKEFLSLADDLRKVSDAKGVYPLTATQWVDTSTPLIGSLLEVLHAAGKVSEAITKASLERAYLDLMTAFGFLGFGLAVTLGCFWVVAYGIVGPMKGLVVALKKLADGDFRVSLPGVGRKDEIGQISDATELIVDRFGATIFNIKSATSEIANVSSEISTSTTELSQRTEEQAASLEETTAAMEELSATVKKNADNAQQASQSANSTRDVADRGGQVVAKAVEAMAKIEDSSRKISDICARRWNSWPLERRRFAAAAE